MSFYIAGVVAIWWFGWRTYYLVRLSRQCLRDASSLLDHSKIIIKDYEPTSMPDDIRTRFSKQGGVLETIGWRPWQLVIYGADTYFTLCSRIYRCDHDHYSGVAEVTRIQCIDQRVEYQSAIGLISVLTDGRALATKTHDFYPGVRKNRITWSFPHCNDPLALEQIHIALLAKYGSARPVLQSERELRERTLQRAEADIDDALKSGDIRQKPDGTLSYSSRSVLKGCLPHYIPGIRYMTQFAHQWRAKRLLRELGLSHLWNTKTDPPSTDESGSDSVV